MTEWKEKRQQRQYMVYNLVAFTIIFGLFATIIYLQIQQSLYSRLDDDLREAREMIEGTESFVDHQLDSSRDAHDLYADGGMQKNDSPPEAPEHRDDNSPSEGFPPDGERQRDKIFIPFRVQVIIRDGQGEVQNGIMLGRLFWENAVSLVPFSADRLEEIQNFRMDDGSSYRGMSFAQTGADGKVYYIQLLSNADGEQGIIDSFLSILVVCAVVFILLSFSASYLLSKKSMAPLMCAWKRQTEFVENASHELRTPLTVIQNKLESLLLTPNATILDKADNIAISLSETRRLSKLTTDLMTLARADSSELQLAVEAFPLDELVEKVVSPYRELAEAQDKSLEVALEYGGELQADRGRIHELLVILLDNALKYTREGDAIQVSTALRETRVVLRVSDTGIGVSQESMERIFDRFYREDKARSRESGGTGLGLSIAHWIVSTHGGSIRALPGEPRGTILEVRLPR